MDKLVLLLHELIDHAIPHPNRRGELHGLVDELAAGPVEAEPAEAEPAEPAVPPVPVVPFKEPADPPKTDGAKAV